MEDMVIKQYTSSQNRFQAFYKNHPDQVPQKVLQKLQILQDSIENRQLTNYSLLNQDEVQQLIAHSIQVKTRMFIDIASSFMYQEKFVEGSLDVKGKSGLFWNSKQIKIDLEKSIISISRKKPQNEFQSICLDQCSIKWIGQMKGRHCFQLLGKKVFTMGSEDSLNAERWFSYIKQCCHGIDEEQLKKMRTERLSFASSRSGIEGQFQGKQQKSEVVQQQSQIKKEEAQQMKQSEQKIEKSIKQEQYLENSKIEQSIEFKLDESTDSVEKPVTSQQIKQDKKQIDESMKQYLNKQFMNDEYNYGLIRFKKKLRMLENKENPLIHKAAIVLNTDNIQLAFSILSSPDEMKGWNTQIESISILDSITSENCIVINEIRKKFGLLYVKRKFTYLRQFYQTEDGYYIVDKSINYQCPNNEGYSITGNMKVVVYGLYQTNSNAILLNVYSELTNGGYANNSQDSQLTQLYIKELENINDYIQQKENSFQKLPYFLENFTINQRQNTLNSKSQIVQKQFIEDTQFEQQQEVINSGRQSLKQQQLLQETDTLNKSDIQNQQSPLQSSKLNYQQLLETLCSNPQELWQKAIHQYITNPWDCEKEYFEKTEDGYHIVFRQDWEIVEKGGLKFINKKKLEIQKDVITYILKRLGSNLMQGKFSLVSISLPVTIFEKRSNLQRLCHSFTFLQFLEKAAESDDPLEQMKYIVCFMQGSLLLYLNMEKPFNPILGETYQGYSGGNLLYAEQVTHHPPAAALMIYGKNFQMTGHLEQQAFFSMNSITGQNYGYLEFRFKRNNSIFKCNTCPGCITGMSYGSRIFYLDGLFWIISESHKLLTEIQNVPFPGMFTKKTTPQDWLDGGIYKIGDKELNKFKQDTYKKYSSLRGQAEKISNITGRWNQAVLIDGIERLNWSKDHPYKLIDEENPLASDCNLREDVVALRMDDLRLSQEMKEKLEVIQRADRKLREKKKK